MNVSFHHHTQQQKNAFHACFFVALVCGNQIDLQDRYKWFTLFLPLFNCGEMCSYQWTKHKSIHELADPGALGMRSPLSAHFLSSSYSLWQFCQIIGCLIPSVIRAPLSGKFWILHWHIWYSHRQIHKTLDHLPSLVVEAGLEQVRPFCCWYSTITLVSYVHKYAFPFFSSKLR